MINLKTLIVYLLIAPCVYGQVREYETTRLKGTGGAGVGSLLLTDAAILNPASLAFFMRSAVYVHQVKSDFDGPDKGRRALNRQYSRQSDTKALIFADTKRQLRGAAAYVMQKEGYDERKRIYASMAHHVGKQSAFGVQYRRTEDMIQSGSFMDKQEYNQTIFGATHVVDKNFSLGLLLIDPFKAKSRDNKIIFGSQLVIQDILAIMLDAGTDYMEDPSDELLYRVAVQVNFLSDFYLRAGHFNDKGLGEKGSGIGASWVGPKIGLDISYKTTKATDPSISKLAKGESLKETSLSISYVW